MHTTSDFLFNVVLPLFQVEIITNAAKKGRIRLVRPASERTASGQNEISAGRRLPEYHAPAGF